MLGNQLPITTVTVSSGHVITICDLYCWFLTSRVSGVSQQEVANGNHIMSHLTTGTKTVGTAVVKLMWSHDIMLYDHIACLVTEFPVLIIIINQALPDIFFL